MSKAMNDLMNDHEAIMMALDIFSRMLDLNGQTAKSDQTEFSGFLDFLKEFTDKCHHGKEEGILFPAMIGAGVPDRGGPISVMVSEHIQGRGLIHDMEEALEEPGNIDRFNLAGRNYVNLLRTHIQKENSILFPLAEKLFSPAVLEQMYFSFEQHEEKVIGHGRHEELHAMLDTLKAKYPDRKKVDPLMK